MRLRGSFLLVLLFAVRAPVDASDSVVYTPIPEWVIAGIAAVETGSTYRQGDLIHYRDRRDGADGEVGPWQIAPAALDDLGAARLRARIRHEPVLAESLTRAWLLRCHRRTGDWLSAVAIYHTGPRGDRQRGRRYAERVFAAGNQP